MFQSPGPRLKMKHHIISMHFQSSPLESFLTHHSRDPIMIIPRTPFKFKERATSRFGSGVGFIDDNKRFTYKSYYERGNRLANTPTKLGIREDEEINHEHD